MNNSHLNEFEINFQSNLRQKESNIEDANGLVREKEDDLVLRNENKKA